MDAQVKTPVNSSQYTVNSKNSSRGFEFDFEKLTVYKKTLDFIHEVFKIYKNIPREFQYSLGSNLVRASVSIADNIAEGSGKQSNREKKRYYGISLDSARECVSVFSILRSEGLIDDNNYTDIRLRSKEVTSMLAGLINSLN
jgi:four helix bundle protein